MSFEHPDKRNFSIPYSGCPSKTLNRKPSCCFAGGLVLSIGTPSASCEVTAIHTADYREQWDPAASVTTTSARCPTLSKKIFRFKGFFEKTQVVQMSPLLRASLKKHGQPASFLLTEKIFAFFQPPCVLSCAAVSEQGFIETFYFPHWMHWG